MSDELDLGIALADVRKAYRLLWCYQKRVFDILRLIVSEFDDRRFYYWRSAHTDPPAGSGSDPTERWTWDMLPMVEASYLYLQRGVFDPNSTQPGQWMLEVKVTSDTGFKDPGQGRDPDPEDFAAAPQSNSSISIYAWYCTGATTLNWFYGVWKRLVRPEIDGELVESAAPPFRVVGKTFDIATLIDKDAVRAAASEFKTMASKALGVALV